MAANLPEGASPRGRAWTWFFNPFHYIAGAGALGLGVTFILATGLVSAWSGSHFDGVLDFHPGGSGPIWVFLADGIVAWLALSVFLAVTGNLVSRTKVRLLDVFGTQALARAPMLLTAIAALLPGCRRLAAALKQAAMNPAGLSQLHPKTAEVITFGFVVLVSLTMLVWMVALMYRAYAVSCNAKGGRAVISFIVALALAEAASKFALHVIVLALPQLYKEFIQ